MGVATVTHRVVFGFKVTRRIGWDGEGAGDLQRHFKAVCDQVAQSEHVSSVHVRADLEEAALELDLDVEAASEEEAEVLGRVELSSAIRETGALHVGLLSEIDEIRNTPKRSMWGGLRTPSWQTRRMVTVEPISS
jgi:hypothetical protein